MKKRSKKIRNRDKKVVSLPATIHSTETYICGFRINKEKHNRLWRWDTLEDV
jgi:hypothetical protein